MIQKILESHRLYIILLVANVIVTLFIFILMFSHLGGDVYTYMGLAEGILHGRYSFWWFLPHYHPDTFRNPGYPVFIASIKLFSESYKGIKITQLVLYLTSIYFILRITDHYSKKTLTKNILLVLLLMSINVTAYVDLILPEILTLFLVTASVYTDLKIENKKWYKYVILGLLYGYIFQIRPVFLFVPFLKLAYDWHCRKDRQFYYLYQALTIIVFILTMMPYAYWNKKNNGVFSITSLEGGGGVVHASQWGFKIPNYEENRYWGNDFSEEIISEKDPEKVRQNVIAYNKEWDYIDSCTKPYITQNDSEVIEYKTKNKPFLWITYNAKYTMAREKLLKEMTLKHAKEDIPYTLKIKVYTFFRIWYTNLLFKNSSVTSKFKVIPYISQDAIVSFLSIAVFLLGLIFIPLAYFKNSAAMARVTYPVILLLYFGFIHTPFAIQARYTTPVKLLLIMVIAHALSVIFFPGAKEDE